VPSDIDPLRRGIETSTQKTGTRSAVGGGRFDFRHTVNIDRQLVFGDYFNRTFL